MGVFYGELEGRGRLVTQERPAGLCRAVVIA